MIIKKKIFLTIFVFLILFSTLICRSFYLQVYNRDRLIRYADTQFIRESQLYPQRGQILDRDLTPLAVNVQKFDLFAMPQQMKKISSIYALCKVVENLNCHELAKKLQERQKFTWLARELTLTKSQVAKIKKMEGVYLEDKFSRFYPHQSVAAALIGQVNVDHKGLAGVEYAFDHELKGMPKYIRYFKDAKGRPIRLESIQFNGKGQDVILSIDHDLQAMTEKFLAEGVAEAKALSGGAVVMNPKTGEILALATAPSFNPNFFNKYTPQQRKLSALTDPFEPGSVFKIFTIAAALEEKVITPDSKYYCENGKMNIGKHVVSEASGHHYGWLTVNDIFKFSSNIGTTKIAMDLGYQKFNQFLKKLKFGEQTGIELKGESRGIYKEIKKPSLIHLSNLSFGQGIATTPLQIITAYSAIANDGLMVTPTILRAEAAKTPNRVMSLTTARLLQKMLTNVVDNGTGFNAKISQFNIAGKTSTAQKVGPDGHYSGIMAGFIGFPLDLEQKVVVYVYVDDPKSKIYGNDVAAPIFQKIMSYYLYQAKDISPTRFMASKDMIADSVKNTQSSIVRVKDDKTIPNFIGLDKLAAHELGSLKKINIEMQGFGVVEKQVPAPYTPLSENTKVILKFKEPEF